MKRHALILSAILWVSSHASGASSPSFAEFDRRAKAGERLSVVFFGASLTWGANASDPQWTSYRAKVAAFMEEKYPEAHFTFRDAAIGGTGSQLGVFRLDRDVLSRKPGLVFLDFSANDDIYSDRAETLASYEALLRRLIVEAKCPVVQVIFPFKWNVANADTAAMKRRDAHLGLSRAYNTVSGDAIALAIKRVKSGETTLERIWPFDGVHPGDSGYQLFADAACAAYQDGVARNVVCAAPVHMRHADTYLKRARVRISSLGELPSGWKISSPNLTSAYYDMLMSRWLDDEVVASNRKEVKNPEGKKTLEPQETARLKVVFRGTMVMLFGESTPKSGRYRAYIDGKLVERTQPKSTAVLREFDASGIAASAKGNAHHVQVIAEGLDAAIEHTLEIEPVFASDKEQEIRLESICVAGGDAWVKPASTERH